LTKLFTGPNPDIGLDLLHESDLLTHILPEIEEMRGVPQQAESLQGMDVFMHTCSALGLLRKPSAVLAFGTLLHDVGKPPAFSLHKSQCFEGHAPIGGKIAEEIGRRLRMSNREIDHIVDLVRTHMDFLPLSQMPQSRLKRLLFKSNIEDHLELSRVNCISNQRSLDTYSDYLKKLSELRKEPKAAPLITGTDLIEMGYPPGPIFAEMLRKIEDLQLEGILRTREEAIHFLKSYIPGARKNQS
jgi:tRNA nucleotidyltransferase (CCA-adding enzyme)